MNMKLAVKVTYFLLRVVTGLLFFQVGSAKLLGWFGGMPGGATPPLMSQIGIGGLLELVGGIAIMLGLLTRPVAFILSGEMAVAYWQFHAPNGTWPIQNHGEPAVLFCFIFLYMAAQGGGEWSLDALIRQRRGGVADQPGLSP
jgi:putative oxidoreductase